jgi:hypothetical protein
MNLQDNKASPGFFASFFQSCINLSFYPKLLQNSWKQVIMHGLVLVVLSTISYAIAFHSIIQKPIKNLVEDIPAIKIKNGKGIWDSDLKTPYIRRIPPAGARKFYYIIDSGKNQRQLEDKYQMYALFTREKFILNDGKNRKETSLKSLEENSLLQEGFFGKPLVIDEKGLAKFISFYASITFGFLFFFLPLLILFPLGNLLVAVIANIMEKWPVSFVDIYKLSFYAATPTCLILIFGCLFLMLNWTLLLLGLSIAWIVQIAYLITGLRACRLNKVNRL